MYEKIFYTRFNTFLLVWFQGHDTRVEIEPGTDRDPEA